MYFLIYDLTVFRALNETMIGKLMLIINSNSWTLLHLTTPGLTLAI